MGLPQRAEMLTAQRPLPTLTLPWGLSGATVTLTWNAKASEVEVTTRWPGSEGVTVPIKGPGAAAAASWLIQANMRARTDT